MLAARITIAAVSLLLAGCAAAGSGATSSTSPSTARAGATAARQAVLASVARARAQSFRLDADLTGSVAGSGSLAGLGRESVGVKMHLDVASPSSISGTVTMSLDGFAVSSRVVSAGGIEYASSDQGKTWKPVPGATPADLSAPLEYLQSAQSVSDTGPSPVSGRSTEVYLVTLDPQKMTELLQNIATTVGAGNAAVTRLLSEVSFSDGQLTAYIDGGGDLVKESGYIDASVDAAAVETGATGRMTVHGDVETDFSDYGSAIRVTPPPLR
jgi:hypothetical protein